MAVWRKSADGDVCPLHNEPIRPVQAGMGVIALPCDRGGGCEHLSQALGGRTRMSVQCKYQRTTARVQDPSYLDCNGNDDDGEYERIVECLGEPMGEPGIWGFRHIRKGFGWAPATNQYSISMTVRRGASDEELGDVRREVEEIIQYIRPIRGRRPIRVYEHTHGDDGVYDLAQIEESGDWGVVHHYYGSARVIHTGTLREMLERIRADHWTEDGE